MRRIRWCDGRAGTEAYSMGKSRVGREWVGSRSLGGIGGGLLIATGAIHLDLYLTGYRTILTIGWLFLLQVITAFALGALVLVYGSRLAAAVGAGFVLSTLGGYLLSLRIGLFGFREVRTTAGIVAGVIEVVGFAALAALALGWGTQRGAQSSHHSQQKPRGQAAGERPGRLLGVPNARRTGRGAARHIRGGSGTNPNQRRLGQPARTYGQHQWGIGPDQCPWLHAVLVCPRYADQIGLLGRTWSPTAAGDRASSPRPRGDGEARHDQTIRRRIAGNL